MLIVYQSLESTGTRKDEPSFITGNSFKHKVHDSLQPQSLQRKVRVWEKGKVTYNTITLETPFATAEESKELSKRLKKLDKDQQDKTAVEILEKIVARIVDNAAACTRPPGSLLPFVRRPDIIVLGEIYVSSLVNEVLSGYVVVGGINPSGDARHRFMVLVQTGLNGKTPAPGYAESIETILYGGPPDNTNKDEDSKCMLIKVRGWLIAFVHTPNNICNDPDRAATYLHNNAQRVEPGAKLDLVMGDTNQSSSDTVQSYMNRSYNRIIRTAMPKNDWKPGPGTIQLYVDPSELLMRRTTPSRGPWEHSIMPNRKQVVRGYRNYEVSGTNSNYDKHFDIACTPQAHVSLTGLTVHDTKEDELIHDTTAEEPTFLFHGLTDKFIEWEGKFYAYSDHNGVIVEVLRDKPDFQFTSGKKRRRERIDEFRERKRKRTE